jgi:hypothetical protein
MIVVAAVDKAVGYTHASNENGAMPARSKPAAGPALTFELPLKPAEVADGSDSNAPAKPQVTAVAVPGLLPALSVAFPFNRQ